MSKAMIQFITKFIFLLIINLVALVVCAFSQDLSSTQQYYGDSPLVNFDFRLVEDSASVYIHTDEDLLEIVSLGYIRATDKSIEEYVNDIDQKKNYSITFLDLNCIFLKTKYGVTSIFFYKYEGENDGYIAVNGRLIGKVVNGGLVEDLGAMPEDFFKDKIDWAWSPRP